MLKMKKTIAILLSIALLFSLSISAVAVEAYADEQWESFSAGGSRAIQVEVGAHHNLVLMNDGTVWAWGWNNFGQLGDGTTEDRLTPTRVIGLYNVVSISGGSHHSLAMKSDGTIWAWGDNRYGQLGDGTINANRLQPVQIPGLSDIAEISAGNFHSLALGLDGTAWAWGYNWFGQLGDGTQTNRLQPVQIPGLSDIAEISAGNTHSLAMGSDGTVWACA